MVELNTAQKVPITVTDANGIDITAAVTDDHISVEGTSITAHKDVEQGTFYVAGVGEGDSNLVVDIQGQHGELAFTVALGPLTLTAGEPEPK